ncbi:STM4011 family radical SAM protein [Aeoliella sp.]|uniref:STM4011 family radical SAM protein n=1 Tax=Aeoliella sp. TaxID=2795800 RepID=UPI003CCC2950
MSVELSILYRGTLSSCNYDCPYCPFAKHWESPDELDSDRKGLERFIDWATCHSERPLSVFFTPWGEALVRSWYRDAVVSLTHLSHVRKVAVQTNLSCNLDWVGLAEAGKLGLWCTYHPGQTSLGSFLKQCERLSTSGVSYSVGCVGLREHFSEIDELRRRLPPTVYLWINAFKSQEEYYDLSAIEQLTQIDPQFPVNNQRHPSRGKHCLTGETVVTVDSQGNVRRCHFVDEVIGNLYDANFEHSLRRRLCPNDTCGCHIGYVHLEHLDLQSVYGAGILERVPQHVKSLPSNRSLA